MAWPVVKKQWAKKDHRKGQSWQPRWVASQKKWQPKWKRSWDPQIWVRGCDPDTKVDGEARYTGVVKRFYKWKGVGFLDIDQKGVVTDDCVFVHWSNIQTDDRFPFLVEGMQVEFGLQVWRFQKRKSWQQKKEAQIRAKYVTDFGGKLLALQDRLDAEKKTFVGGQHYRYSGMLEHYDAQKGTGSVIVDDGFTMEEPVPKKLLVEEPEVNAGGKKPKSMSKLRVEFGIWKTKQGRFKAYNMTLPDGLAMTDDNIDKRKVVGPEMYHGTISQWWWKQGWGFIIPSSTAKYPLQVKRALSEMQAAAQRKASWSTVPQAIYFCKKDIRRDFHPQKGHGCMFQIYTDEKGVGATHIQCLADSRA